MREKIFVAIAAAGAVIGLAACGGSTSSSSLPGSSAPAGAPSSQTLLSDALTALKSAQSVRMAGDITESGKNLRLNADFVKSGSLRGMLSGPFAGTSATLELIVVGGKAYVLLDKTFFNELVKSRGIPGIACSTLCGKYIELPASQFGDFSFNGLTSSLLKGENKAAPGVVATTLNGQPAYRISDGHGGFLYIAENGTHYPLEITKAGTGTVTFNQWNSVPPITAPPSSQIVSLPSGL